MDNEMRVLESSVASLRDLVTKVGDDKLTAPAYPTEWSIADVLSHLGSGAVIMRRRLEDGIIKQPTSDDFAPSVWDTWNAKSPQDKAADALVADREAVERLASTTAEERSEFKMAFGPFSFDMTGVVRLRINEHALHLWDIEVALDPSAVVAPDAVDVIVDNLELIGRFAAKPSGEVRTVTVRTDAPERHFTIDLAADAVTFTAGPIDGEPMVQMPSEAFVRLVYGRLDPERTPELDGSMAANDAIAALRKVFPGP